MSPPRLRKSAVMIQWWLRIKEERSDRSPHREAKQLVLVTLAWLSFVSIAAAQTSAPPNPDLPARGSNAGLTVAEWVRGETDRNDPTGMSRPYDRFRGGAPTPDPWEVRRLL